MVIAREINLHPLVQMLIDYGALENDPVPAPVLTRLLQQRVFLFSGHDRPVAGALATNPFSSCANCRLLNGCS